MKGSRNTNFLPPFVICFRGGGCLLFDCSKPQLYPVLWRWYIARWTFFFSSYQVTLSQSFMPTTSSSIPRQHAIKGILTAATTFSKTNVVPAHWPERSRFPSPKGRMTSPSCLLEVAVPVKSAYVILLFVCAAQKNLKIDWPLFFFRETLESRYRRNFLLSRRHRRSHGRQIYHCRTPL